MKWRHHCCTCGLKYSKPSTWAYCSKACELLRGTNGTKRAAADAERRQRWLDTLADRRLMLARRLEVCRADERAEILRLIAAVDAAAAATPAE